MEPSDSATDRYALVGHPVAHSRSPMIHRLFARQTGQQLSYELIDAEPASFETAVRGFQAAGGKGLNVTVPHKEAAFELAEELGPEARRAGAVNTLSFRTDRTIRGDNTDGAGFMRDLTVNLDESVEGRRVLILGAGGAARGIIAPLLDAAPRELVIANRTVERAEALLKRLEGEGEGEGAGATRACSFAALDGLVPFDLLINATSAGLKGETPPFPESIIGSESFCYDLVYSRNDTPFVLWARGCGARRAVQGWGMLVEQAAESFLIWRGVRPDTAVLVRRARG